VRIAAISWNLFHGRDFPPDPALLTWRSRLLRIAERNGTHVQVNRGLLSEFAGVLAATDWDVALLQECPPRFAEPLARACDAEAHRVLTSRNSFSPLRQLAARLNPDLIASGEGGSNLILVRSSAVIRERRAMAIHDGPLERRTMGFVRIGCHTGRPSDGAAPDAELCVANLHASAHRPDLAAEDVLRGARAATEWAGEAPLLFGGDFNLRPQASPEVFAALRERFGLAPPTAPNAIDHLLARGLEIVERPRRWPPQAREVRCDGLALRLSDHAPVEATFATPGARE
jgi:endonuclease/exonuclease/phosphatase family metal-dependent hydrolase